jgi:hypothetical protein
VEDAVFLDALLEAGPFGGGQRPQQVGILWAILIDADRDQGVFSHG